MRFLAPTTSRTLRVLSRLAAWAVEEGIALDAESILDPDTVERFVTQGLTGDPSRATYRSVLRRIGPLLTRTAPWEPRPATMARRQVAQPYATVEIETLVADRWAPEHCGKAAGRRGPSSLSAPVPDSTVAGSPGSGQRTSSLMARWFWSRSVSLTPRSVPVLAGGSPRSLSWLRRRETSTWSGGYSTSRNRASSLASGLAVPPGHPRLSAARLRSTWLLWHLCAGTRLPELATAAGLQGVTVLSDLLDHVPPISEPEARRLLRGAVR